MTNEEWMTFSKPTVDFLHRVFADDYTTVAKVITMQADRDVDGLCKALEVVSEFCSRQIKEFIELDKE